MLMLPETFAEKTPRPAALHRAANFPAGDHAQPGGDAVRQAVPVGDQTALGEALAPLSDPREITVLTESLGAAQSPTWASGVRRLASGV